MNWDGIYRELQKRMGVALDETPDFSDRDFVLDVQMRNYPPRIAIEIWYPATKDNRRYNMADYRGAVYENLTDDELRVAVAAAMQFYKKCGGGLKIFRGRRPERGVLSYVIKPRDYGDWSDYATQNQ